MAHLQQQPDDHCLRPTRQSAWDALASRRPSLCGVRRSSVEIAALTSAVSRKNTYKAPEPHKSSDFDETHRKLTRTWVTKKEKQSRGVYKEIKLGEGLQALFGGAKYIGKEQLTRGVLLNYLVRFVYPNQKFSL